jgi:SAM-dependent methyltransferase
MTNTPLSRRLTPRRAVAGVARRIPRRPFVYLLPYRPLRPLVRFWVSVVGAHPDRRLAARRVLEVYQDVYEQLDQAAIRHDDGVHAKHRLMRYHDFFVERVRRGERVLDVGCGKGELAADLVERAGATVVGIDFDPSMLEFARTRFSRPELTFLDADAASDLPEGPFDVVVLSNVLEHVEDRVGLLRRLVETARPSRVLVRVPILDRDWTVPFRRELGLPYFSDPGHFTEYDPDSLRAELAQAGLEIDELQQVWGELWAAARPGVR